MKSVMQHSFSQVPRADIPRSTFDRSHGYKTTFDSGYLVPILCDEVLPGDTFNLRTSLFARLATPLKPFMDNLFLDVFYFFVPLRLLWTNFQRFMGEQDNPDDSTDFQVPQITINSSQTYGSLTDYFGLPLPTGAEEEYTVAAWWHRGYHRIFNDWFRDQNFISQAPQYTDDGPDDCTDYALLRRCKRHDYFTSALPWPQKGPDVLLPLGSTAPVWGSSNGLRLSDGTNDFYMGLNDDSTAPEPFADLASGSSNDAKGAFVNGNSRPSGSFKVFGVASPQEGFATKDAGLYADLESATASTINAIRQAFQLQRLYERDARAGSRYVEIIRSHFNCVSPDFRLQRSEFLGSHSTRININPVQQTSSTVSGSPQGNLAAYGMAADNSSGFVKSFTEHGIIMGICNVRADITY